MAKKQSLLIKPLLRYNEVTDISTTDSTISKKVLHTAFLGSTLNFHFFYTPDKVTIVKAESIQSFTITETTVDSNYVKWLKY